MLRVYCNGCRQPFGKFIKDNTVDTGQYVKWHCGTCSAKRAAFEDWCAKKRQQMEDQLDDLVEAKREEVFG
jgi:hypothetical protein